VTVHDPPAQNEPIGSDGKIGAVVIGRNEGDRLRVCLESLAHIAGHLVYVDSGSTDGSQRLARQLGADVVDLDLSEQFTAARARNAGLQRLLEVTPGTAFVQFVDGDCEVVAGWLDEARSRLLERSELGVVCGRRRERHPAASVYNLLCDLEWETPVGDTLACGGDAMMRVEALGGVGGFDPTLIAGEEPELCVRLRAEGWVVERLDVEMTLHDADMTRFAQWWQRSVRGGHAFAEGAHMHRERGHWVRESRRSLLWGMALPAAAFAGAPFTSGRSLLLLLAYPLNAARVFRNATKRDMDRRHAAVYAPAVVLGKVPEAQGALRFHLNQLRGRRSDLIEYK
jgi:glycosyltransferase involved in cell wall biosynthesis